MELTKEMEALVAQHLPQMAAGQMTEFIAQAKKDAADLRELKAKLENTEHQLKDYHEKASTVEQTRRLCEDRTIKLEAAVKKLRNEELALDLAKNKLVADVAIAELKGVKETMGLFLKNVTVRSNVIETVGIPVAATPPSSGNQYGSPAFVHQQSQNSFKTEEKE